MFYSKSTRGFYTEEIHGTNIPSDAVAITPEQHQALLEGQSSGKELSSDKHGHPILVEPKRSYVELRIGEYPPITDYIDGVVKGDQAQIDAYIAACNAVKAKYPKP